MKLMKLIWVLVLLGATGLNDAMADRGSRHRHFDGPSVRFGLVFGPYWGPWYSPPNYPPIVIEQAPPPVYIEQSSEAAPSAYWYYCDAAKAYYPYVKECPDGWQKVPPRPADQP